ncbi:Nucleotidyl transferase AbiEii toxin, Type IV TA system [Fodinibius salinus]|uniref:Nucleotidyl transferase AbiEii toxin, Type IV TA system n=1 Tax=Fodinibius salinus TaxID=860790 RepID=A0A5D3YMQ6_9BACT|nr:nucleotidyl transferase AbiEii/AbiGii toxin family protein [Fodinibius salinus]TYP93997.1 Nucleotidyl transferase AbiEii toxin, Type IV TA system [Fodinibius salinus]
MIDRYRDQVRLLLKVLPVVAEVEEFALKGGTAINFFWRNLPRLSVDIDLTYIPIKNREESLNEIKKGIKHIGQTVSSRIGDANVTTQKSGGILSKLLIRSDGVQVKLEVNTVLRGSLFGSVEKELVTSVQDEFELFAAVPTLSMEDLYGGKLCAALDRQHPRDLFDVKLLLENEGLTDKIIVTFIGYLISHSRPINELLNPSQQDLEGIYENEFQGMTNEAVSLEDLTKVQKKLPKLLLDGLSDEQKEFLLSFQQADPKWGLMPVDHLKELPGVQWKLINIRKMDDKKHEETREKLEKVLGR